MAKIYLVPKAIAKLETLEAYYMDFDPALAERVHAVIFESLRRVASRPLSGRPQLAFPAQPSTTYREITIPFGNAGFVALYRNDPDRDRIVILALRHQREAGYGDVEL